MDIWVSLKTVWRDKLLFSYFIIFFTYIFLGDQRISWFLFDIIILFTLFKYLLTRYKTVYNNKTGITIISILIILNIVVNFALEGISIIALLKIYYVFKFVIVIFIFNNLLHYKGVIKTAHFVKLVFVLCLLQFFINAPIIYNQFLSNPLDIDEHNGLFGNGSSHFVTFVWIFIVLYMLKHSFSAYYVMPIILLMIVLSSFIEGKFFIFGLASVFFIHLFQKINIKKISKEIKYLLLIIPLLFIVFSNIPFVEKYFESRMVQAFNVYVINRGSGSERTEMLGLTLSNDKSKYFGNGSGSITKIFHYEGDHISKIPHIHMNMHSISTLIYEFGILFFLLVTCIYTLLLDSLFKKNNYLRTILIFNFLLFLSYYSRIYKDPRIFYSILLISVTYTMQLSSDGKLLKNKKLNYIK